MSKEAMKLAKAWFERNTYGDEAVDVYEALCEALAEQALDKMAENARELGLDYEPAQEPVAFLANGTRFKISYDSRQSGGQIHGIPPELAGRWVAFVAADDDCHLKLASPQPAQQEPFGYFKAEPFGWTDCAETDEGAVALYERPQPAQQEPCKACNGTGEIETGIGMMVCDECHGTTYTPPQPAQQEPVAYAVYHRMGGGKSLHWPEQHSPNGDANEYQLVPLYTSPPAQRTWVGLSDTETEHFWEISRAAMPRYHTFKTLIEKALRERNT